jgi:LmbE family N-acetylglucosaminyl deacetylase
MSAEPRRLMAVLAHPDDESLGFGSAIALSVSEGVQVSVVTATRGDHGRYGDNTAHPGPAALGRIREAELRAAAQELGVGEVSILGYPDGQLDRVDPSEAVGRIVEHLRRVRPQVVVTFDPFGAYGHPDHIAISQFATAAVVAAADAGYAPASGPEHRVAKLYYYVGSPARWAAYQEAFKKLVSQVDSVERAAVPWPEWSITTRLDTAAYWPVVWKAIQCHNSQLVQYRGLAELTPEHHQALWGTAEFYRVFSLVNGGRTRETSLFEGIP